MNSLKLQKNSGN